MKLKKSDLIAVIGVSREKSKYGYKIFKKLLTNNYNVIGINPRAKKILNQKIYPSLSSLPQKPELVIFVVPPQISLNILKDCAKENIKNIWFQPGSFDQKVLKKAKKLSLNYTANSCFLIKNNLT